MFKYRVITFILLTVVFGAAKAHCLDEIKDQPARTVSGTVIYLDTAGDALSVKTDFGTMQFYLTVESVLYQSFHHIASIEILKGDPVTIQYASSSDGKNIITRLVDNRRYNY